MSVFEISTEELVFDLKIGLLPSNSSAMPGESGSFQSIFLLFVFVEKHDIKPSFGPLNHEIVYLMERVKYNTKVRA